jgi:hypothetical protein
MRPSVVKTWILILAFVGALPACGSPVEKSPSTRQPSLNASGDLPALVVGTGTVLEPRDGRPTLCLGGVMDSLPPQCSGLPLRGWDWKEVDDEERASGATWGAYRVTGRFDGTTLTLTKPPEPPVWQDHSDAAITAPCPEPDGGWEPKGTQEDIQPPNRYAQNQPGFAGLWVDHIGEPPHDELSPIVLTVAFIDMLARHESELRKLWEGPLCLVQFDRTLDELQTIQSELDRKLAKLGYGSTFSDISVTENTVTFGVVFATDELREELDERFGSGVVEVQSALTPVD